MHPDAWSLGIIKPILKKKCPSNYRGITLLPVMGNLVKHSLVLDQEDELLTQSNEFGKEGRKKPRNIPKFTINHERFSCAIGKNI